ncbi:hypothetical protein BGZ63DRAFT_396086 [Mariannaea sp. PMI_226]|nr:hypothetical protein BGZ63DRAFT_396086 [Mariannaea sp. PMI_226]
MRLIPVFSVVFLASLVSSKPVDVLEERQWYGGCPDVRIGCADPRGQCPQFYTCRVRTSCPLINEPAGVWHGADNDLEFGGGVWLWRGRVLAMH